MIILDYLGFKIIVAFKNVCPKAPPGQETEVYTHFFLTEVYTHRKESPDQFYSLASPP